MPRFSEVRWSRFVAVRSMFVVAVLQLGATWTLSQPSYGSSRTKWASVGGGGMVYGSGTAVFCFGTAHANPETWNSENEIDPTASGTTWSETIQAPTNGWSLSPLDQFGMAIGSHTAWVEWTDGGTQRALTGSHKVTAQ